MSFARTRAGTALILVAALAGCGGGSSVLTPPPIAPSHPASIPTPAAAANASTVHVGESPSTTALPLIGSVPMSIALPSADAAADLTVTEETGSAVNGVSNAANVRHRTSIGTLPQGPYIASVDFTTPKTLTLRGTVGASFDVGPLLSSDQKTALSFLLAINPKLYVGVLDPAGGFTAIGPLAFNGTSVTAALPVNPITVTAGQTYRIGLHDGVLTSVPAPVASATPSLAPSLAPSPSASPSVKPSAAPSPSASPSAAPSASPSAAPSASPSAAPSASPSVAPSASPSVAPSSSATPTDNIAQNIDAAGHVETDANAFSFPYAGGFFGSVGYPANNSNVVVANTNAVNGRPAGAPDPGQSETVVYAIHSNLAGGVPNKQSSITFNGQATAISGTLNIPFTSANTFTVYVYAPSFAGNTAIYQSPPQLAKNGKITFSSPFNTGSNFTVPIPVDVFIEVAQP